MRDSTKLLFVSVLAFMAIFVFYIGIDQAAAAPVTTLKIPALGQFDKRVTFTLDNGPAWWPGIQGRPGQGRTVAIASHRTTHGGPFLRINTLKPGNFIYLTWGGHVYKYMVTGHRVLPVTNLHIADDLGFERLILSACAKADGTPTSASYRYVVYARPA